VRKVPAAGTVNASYPPEVDCDSPSGTVTTTSPRGAAASPPLIARPAREAAPDLEERIRELERKLEAKEVECARLQAHVNEVNQSFAEQRERDTQAIKQRDRHIEELSRRNKELLAAHAHAQDPEVAQGGSSGDSAEALGQAKDGSSIDAAGVAAAAGAAAAAAAAAARGGGRFTERSQASPEASGNLDDADMPTLAALRQRLYPKRGSFGVDKEKQRNHLAHTPSTGGDSEASSRSGTRNTLRRPSGSTGTFGTAPNPRLSPRTSEQQTPKRGRN